MISQLVIFLISCSVILAADPTIDIKIDNGDVNATIRGYAHPYGKSWRGIQYAIQPIGKLRFTYAARYDPYGFVSALAYGQECAQGSNGQEACLFLNVFAPANSTANSSLPVYVYIHGGGFTGGSGNLGAGIYPTLVDKGMVLVSINYRLGPFGFFSTRDAMAYGNWAVSDWIEALNWVQRYISFFGGNPRKITLGGHSSGAEAVSLLSLTDKAKGLYNRLIIQSGSAFGAAVMSYSEKTRNTSAQLSVQTGCASSSEWNSGSDFGPILNCLRGLTTAQIVNADVKLPNHRMKWSSVADKKYFTSRLEDLALKRSSVPVLIGDAHDEWLAWEISNIEKNLNSSSNTQEGLRSSLKTSYEMSYWDNPNAVFVAAANKYINNQPFAADDHTAWMAQRIKLYSEMVFIGPVLRDAKYFAYTRSNVYLYSFDYLAPQALPLITQPQLRGVPHGWELQYVMGNSCYGWNCTSNDNQLRTISSDVWANFVIYGNPSPITLPFSFPRIGTTNNYVSFLPNPKSSIDFHTDSQFWACSAPNIDGHPSPFC